MASVKKFTAAAVRNQLRHIERTIENPSNEDIDFERVKYNYSLLHDREMNSYDYYKQRMSELYVYNRSDVKVMAGWIITAPKNLDIDDYNRFFQSCHNFLCDRYGGLENVIQSCVHYDEAGLPHLHHCFIPVVRDMKHGGEKVCANDVLNRKDLRNFHEDLKVHLQNDGIDADVATGITRRQGGNLTVKELKERTRLVERNWGHSESLHVNQGVRKW